MRLKNGVMKIKMKCRGKIQLEKLITSKDTPEERAELLEELQKYMDVGVQQRHATASQASMRAVYNMALADMAGRYGVSKNSMRHNVNYVRSWLRNGSRGRNK